MSYVTIEEFLKMSHEEKKVNYKNMSSHDKFLWRTFYDIPVATVIGFEEISKEELEESEKRLEQIAKKVEELKKNKDQNKELE